MVMNVIFRILYCVSEATVAVLFAVVGDVVSLTSAHARKRGGLGIPLGEPSCGGGFSFRRTLFRRRILLASKSMDSIATSCIARPCNCPRRGLHRCLCVDLGVICSCLRHACNGNCVVQFSSGAARLF